MGAAMDFYVYSRLGIEHTPAHEVPHAIVSIRSPGDPAEVKLRTNEHTKGVLHLQFHDIDDLSPKDLEEVKAAGMDENLNLDPKTLFTEDMGRQVVQFVLAHKDHVERFLVHCDAGLSRSPGAAAAIAVMVGQSDENFFKRYYPNRKVYRFILNAYQETLDG